MLNAEPVSFSEPFQDGTKRRLPTKQAATRGEGCRVWRRSALGREGADGSQKLDFPPLLYKEGGVRRRKAEPRQTTSFNCTLNRVIKLY